MRIKEILLLLLIFVLLVVPFSVLFEIPNEDSAVVSSDANNCRVFGLRHPSNTGNVAVATGALWNGVSRT